MIQYCYYTPGVALSKVCKDQCTTLNDLKYFTPNAHQRMYCRNLDAAQLKVDDLLARPSVNAFNDYLENQYQFRGVSMGTDDEEESGGNHATFNTILMILTTIIALFMRI